MISSSHRLAVLPLLAVTGLVVTASAMPASYADSPVTHHATKTVAVHGKVRSVTVRGDVGDVTVVSGSTHRVVAHETWGTDNRPTVTVTHHGGSLVVRTSCPAGGDGGVTVGDQSTACSADLTVTMPAGATLDAVASTGDLHVRNLTGAATLRTGTGDLTATHLSGRTVRARTGTGDVSVSVPTGPCDYRLSTGTGSTRAHGVTFRRTAARSVRAAAGEGDVTLTGY